MEQATRLSLDPFRLYFAYINIVPSVHEVKLNLKM